MKIHELKCWPEYFGAIWHGVKGFEIRRNDRGYKINDFLMLLEYDPQAKRYTGRKIMAVVMYILQGGQFGLEEGYVCLTIKIVHQYSEMSSINPDIKT